MDSMTVFYMRYFDDISIRGRSLTEFQWRSLSVFARFILEFYSLFYFHKNSCIFFFYKPLSKLKIEKKSSAGIDFPQSRWSMKYIHAKKISDFYWYSIHSGVIFARIKYVLQTKKENASPHYRYFVHYVTGLWWWFIFWEFS